MPRTFKPGQVVSRPGTFIVYHRNHRLGHPSLVEVAVFPCCKCCGEDVRFEEVAVTTVLPVMPLLEDEDFVAAEAEGKAPQSAGKPSPSFAEAVNYPYASLRNHPRDHDSVLS